MAKENRNTGEGFTDSEIIDGLIAAAITDHRDHQIGEHRLDFLVENKIVVELKAIESLENVHFAIVRSYLKAIGLADRLILNFSSMPLTIKRVRRERSFEEVDLYL